MKKILILLAGILTAVLLAPNISNAQSIEVDTSLFFNFGLKTRAIEYIFYDSLIISKTSANLSKGRYSSPEELLRATRIAYSYNDELELYKRPFKKGKRPPAKTEAHYSLLQKATDTDLTFELLCRVDVTIQSRKLSFLKYFIKDYQHGFRYVSVRVAEFIEGRWHLILDPPQSAITSSLLHCDTKFLRIVFEGNFPKNEEINNSTTCLVENNINFHCLKKLYFQARKSRTPLEVNGTVVINKLREKI